jgi:hypothetical protein
MSKYQYETVPVEEGDAGDVDRVLQSMSNAGWRLHPVSFLAKGTGLRVLVFEREVAEAPAGEVWIGGPA